MNMKSKHHSHGDEELPKELRDYVELLEAKSFGFQKRLIDFKRRSRDPTERKKSRRFYLKFKCYFQGDLETTQFEWSQNRCALQNL